MCIDDRRGPLLDVPQPIAELPGGEGYRAVSVAVDWDVQPRAVAQVGMDADVYQALGESTVAAAGVDPTGGDVAQVVRADLDADGLEEVLVTFEKITDPFGAAGDFVVIVVRHPEPDGAVTDQILFEYYPTDVSETDAMPTGGRAALMAVGDFNGDRVMEVVIRSRFWDTRLAELYVVDDDRLVSVAVSGCSL